MQLLLWLLLLPLGLYAAPLSVSVSAESAILINADTGAILYQKNAKKKMYPASITKIATAAYALKIAGNQLDRMMTAEQECIGSVAEEAKQRAGYSLPSYWLVTDCSHIGIKRGEQLSFRDLLYGMMVASADDASNVIAYTLGNESIPHFMDGLNGYLKELGCVDTFFNNPHGLHHPKHVTTAYEMALITREALKNPLFREIVSVKRCTRPKTNKQESTVLVQTNRLLRPGEAYYPKAIGVKTGKTSKAGNTFVSAAKDGDRTLIAVLLNVKERKEMFLESIRLFEAAFNQPKMEKVLVKSGETKFTLDLDGAGYPIKTYVGEDVAVTYYPAEEPKVRAFLHWDKVALPIARDQKLGELHLQTENGKLLTKVPLYSVEEVNSRFAQFFGGAAGWVLLVAGIFGAFYLISRLIRR